MGASTKHPLRRARSGSLTAGRWSAAAYDESYGYDTISSSTTYSYPASGASVVRPRIVAATLTWDAENRPLTMASPTGVGAYGYDAYGTRAVRAAGGATTVFMGGWDLDTTTGAARMVYLLALS